MGCCGVDDMMAVVDLFAGAMLGLLFGVVAMGIVGERMAARWRGEDRRRDAEGEE